MRSHTGSQFQTSVVAAGGIKGFLEIAPGPCGCVCTEGSAGFWVSPMILGLCPSRLHHLWECVVVSCLSAPWFLSKRNQSTQGDGALLFVSRDGAELHTSMVGCTPSRSALLCNYVLLDYIVTTLSCCSLTSGVFGCNA